MGRGTAAPTAADAKTFLDTVNDTMYRLGVAQSQAGWVQQTYITDDTEALNARTNQEYIDAVARFAKDATRFDKVEVPADQRRQLNLLKLSLVMVTPSNPKEAEELTRIAAKLNATYGKGRWCPDPDKPETCLNIDDITKVMATSRDEKRLREVWEGWHTISPPMRNDYARFVELSNKGARELGFADTGAMWRAKYDMPPDDFTKELDRLWDQVRPLYLELHAYVRMKLHEKYGDAVPATGPIPGAPARQHLGAGLVEHRPAGRAARHAGAGFSLTDILKRRNDRRALDMVRTGERFYTSLGFAPLPKTFWERSLFVRPRDREVVCHASAWDIDPGSGRAHQDVHRARRRRTSRRSTTSWGTTSISAPTRISRCCSATARTTAFTRRSATPSRCRSRRNIWSRSACSTRRRTRRATSGLLMSRALEKIAFLPFGLLIDQWRWKVFAGEVTSRRPTTRRGGTCG